MIARLPLMFAAGVILAGLFVKANPDFVENPPESARQACDQLLDLSYCRAAAVATDLHQGKMPQAAFAPPLPDHRRTPGAIDPTISQANIASTICNADFLAARSPQPSWTAAARRRLANAELADQPPENFALDQLVPISLGGAPTDARNLWLQTWTGEHGVARKNALEQRLNRMVCDGQLSLARAQQMIARDWIDTARQVGFSQNLVDLQPPQSLSSVQPMMPAIAQGSEGVVILEAEVTEPHQSYEVPEIPDQIRGF